MKKNILLTFGFSLVPGAGQMYQGYMKRGVSLLIFFSAICALLGTISIPLFAVPLPVIYIYSFFDSFNVRNKIGTENEEKDDYIWNGLGLDGLKNIISSSNKKRFLGYSMIFLGIYIALSNIIPSIAIDLELWRLYNALEIFREYLTPVLIAGLSIFVGIKFIGKK